MQKLKKIRVKTDSPTIPSEKTHRALGGCLSMDVLVGRYHCVSEKVVWLYAFPQHSSLPLFRLHSAAHLKPTFLSNPNSKTLNSIITHLSIPKSNSTDSDAELDSQFSFSDDGDVDIEILKLGKNERRITCRIAINANLETVWNLLTDYERLADFIPGLAVCQLLEKTDNRARLFQIGEQNLAFGLKFNAKGIVDCYEKILENIPFGQRRDIEFKMIEGDFQVFEGKWSIEEMNNETQEVIKTSLEQEFQTTLSYVVDVKPKLWLPVRLVEGRLCREIKLNLLCIREQAQKAIHDKLRTR